MKALRFLKLLPLVVVLAISPVVVDLAFNRGAKDATPKAQAGETKTEDAKEVIELPKEVNDALVKKWIEPALEKAIASYVAQFWQEICEDFEITDEMEKALFWSAQDDGWAEKGDSLTALCVVKPGPNVLPCQHYRKTGDDDYELRFARVIAPVSRPIGLFLGRSKKGACRLCSSVSFDTKTKQWRAEADILKSESKEVRRAVANALKGIDPGMVAALGLSPLNPPPASRSTP